MALTKCTILPDLSGYSVLPGEEVVSTRLDGGAPRLRRDLLGAVSRVSVRWSATPNRYKYLMCFFRGTTISGSLPFLIDLMIDSPTVSEYQATFVPGSFKLEATDTCVFIVVAELDVVPTDVDAICEDYVTMWNEFGEDFESSADLAAFDELVNVTLREDLPGP
jgi:hypothetical protein